MLSAAPGRSSTNLRLPIIKRLHWLLSAPVGGLLAVFGVAPVVSTALSDVDPAIGTHTLVFAAVAVLGAVFGFLALGKVLAHGTDDHTSGAARFGKIIATTVVAIGLATSFLLWESDNLTSWRMAERLQAGPGVTKHRISKHGTQLLKLNVANSREGEPILGSVALPWHLAVSGGLLNMAVRSDGGATSNECAASVKGDLATLDAQCEQWSLTQLEVQPGTGILVLQLREPRSHIGSLEIGFVSAEPRFHTLWILLSWIASAVLLSCMIYVVRDAPAGSTDARHSTGARHDWERQYTYWAAASVLLFVVVANASVGAFVARERTIYAWDFGGHWMSAVTVSRALSKSDARSEDTAVGEAAVAPRTQIKPAETQSFWSKSGPAASVLRSIRYWEYNVAAAIPLALPMSLADGSRMSYALSLVNVYALSAVLILMLVQWTAIRERPESIPAYWPLIPSLAILLFNPFWVPLLRGYIGVCVVAVNLFVLWLYFRRNVNEQRMTELLLMSLLLAVSVILRRWNAYWVVSFFIIATIDVMLALISSRDFSPRAIVRSFSGLFVIGLGALLTLSVVAWPLVVTMLTTDYADIYSAYADSGGSFAGHVGHFVRTFGIGLIGLTLAAVVFLLSNSAYRRLASLLTIQLAVVVVHVSSTQEMGPHHMYLLMPAALLLLGLAAHLGLSRTSGPVRTGAIVLVIAFVANGVASHVAVFAPGGEPARQALAPVVPDNRRTPLVRNDIEEFRRLASFLDAQVAQAGPAARIYVLASSPVFNVATLNMLEISTGIPFVSKDRLLRTADVDKRDGFPKEIFDATLVAIASPVQFHHEPEEQQVIGIPADMILSGTGVGPAFSALPGAFHLDEGVTVRVYQRTRPNTPDERAELSDRLRAAYPERPAIYRP